MCVCDHNTGEMQHSVLAPTTTCTPQSCVVKATNSCRTLHCTGPHQIM